MWHVQAKRKAFPKATGEARPSARTSARTANKPVNYAEVPELRLDAPPKRAKVRVPKAPKAARPPRAKKAALAPGNSKIDWYNTRPETSESAQQAALDAAEAAVEAVQAKGTDAQRALVVHKVSLLSTHSFEFFYCLILSMLSCGRGGAGERDERAACAGRAQGELPVKPVLLFWVSQKK